MNTGGAGSKGGSFKQALKDTGATMLSQMGGPIGGIAGALKARKQMKAQGVKPTFKGMAKGYAGGMFGGPLMGNLAQNMVEQNLAKAGQRDKKAGMLMHGGRAPRRKRRYAR